MTHDEALEALADHPHAWRFGQLCRDDSDPERRDAWRLEVVRIARGDPPTAPAVPVEYGDPSPGPCGGCGPPPPLDAAGAAR